MWTANVVKVGDRIHCKSLEQREKVGRSLEKHGILVRRCEVAITKDEYPDYMLTVTHDCHFAYDWDADYYGEVE